MIVAEIIFWLSVAAVFHSYILFPLILRLLALRKNTSWEKDAKKEKKGE